MSRFNRRARVRLRKPLNRRPKNRPYKRADTREPEPLRRARSLERAPQRRIGGSVTASTRKYRKYLKMAEVTAGQVKQLRERTGAGMMECKKALVEANGDASEAETLLRKWGISSAAKKSSRTTKQGLIGTYIHAGGQLGVMVEIDCESDFVSRNDLFKELVHDVAMHVAAADPRY